MKEVRRFYMVNTDELMASLESEDPNELLRSIGIDHKYMESTCDVS